MGDFIKSQLPDVYNIIKGTVAETALQQNLIDSNSLLSNPLDRWESLFDPSYTTTPTVPFGGIGQVISVTTFTSGSDSGPQRDHTTRIGGAEFSSDTDYHLDITEQQSAGIINVQGHAMVSAIQGKPAISTALQGGNSVAPIGGLSIVEVYVIISLIISAIVSGLFFWVRSRK